MHSQGAMAKILFVNDDEDLAFVCELMLEARGHEVVRATGADHALAVLRRWRPDACVIDHQLGDGRSGVELTRRLRRELRLAMPIIMIGADDGAELLALQAGADAFIAKPFESTDLQAAIERSIAEHAGPRQAAPPRS